MKLPDESPFHPFTNGLPATRKMIPLSDCDVFGLLYNTRYLDYVLDTRQEHLARHFQMDVLHYKHAGGLPVITEHQVTYNRPSKAHEDIIIVTGTLALDHARGLMEGMILSSDGCELRFHQWTHVRLVDPKTGRAGEFTDADIEAYRKTTPSGKGWEASDYRVRVASLRSASS